MPNGHKHKIAVIMGDGIGKEVVPEGTRVLDVAAERFGFKLEWTPFPWSCEYYRSTGEMMPKNGLEILKQYESIFLGAVGYPGVPDHVSLWGLLIPIRRGFQQYVNFRPVRNMRGITSPLRNIESGQIDFCVVRENNEGEYSNIGGMMYEGTEQEFVVQETVFTRQGVERIMRFAFDLARKREKKMVTSVTKSNGIVFTMPYWDEIFKRIAKEYKDVKTEQYHVDALAATFVLIRENLTWWWAATCSGTSSPTWVQLSQAASALRRRPILTLSVSSHPRSNRSTVRLLILRARGLQTPLARSSPGP